MLTCSAPLQSHRHPEHRTARLGASPEVLFPQSITKGSAALQCSDQHQCLIHRPYTGPAQPLVCPISVLSLVQPSIPLCLNLDVCSQAGPQADQLFATLTGMLSAGDPVRRISAYDCEFTGRVRCRISVSGALSSRALKLHGRPAQHRVAGAAAVQYSTTPTWPRVTACSRSTVGLSMLRHVSPGLRLAAAAATAAGAGALQHGTNGMAEGRHADTNP